MENNRELKSRKMGTMPIGKLLATMSIPAILSMLVQAAYNVVDSIFVSRLGENALTAVSLAFPMQMLTLAFALGISIGTNSLIARKLGEGRPDEATLTAQTGMVLAIIHAAVFVVIGISASKPFISAFTDVSEIIDMGTQYLTIVTGVSFGMFIEMLCSKSLQATGNMIIPMIAQLLGAVINIILDPIMIFGLWGFPRLEVAGAAIATVTGQIISMIFSLAVFRVMSHDIHLSLKGYKFRTDYMRKIFQVGAPVMVINGMAGITTTSVNAILALFSTTAIAVLGVYFKVQSFIFMPLFGLTQGAAPIMGYNFGANNQKRFNDVFRLTILVALVIMAAGFGIFQIFPKQLLMMFKADENMMAIGVTAFRTISWSFIPAAVGIVVSVMYQAIGHGFKSLLMTLFRQLILIIPSAWLLGRLFGLDKVWICYPFSEIVCVAIFAPIAFIVVKAEFENKNNEISFDNRAAEH